MSAARSLVARGGLHGAARPLFSLGMAALLLLLLVPAAGADEAWLVVRGAPWCASQSDAMAVRISEAIAGGRNPAQRVDVELAQGRTGRVVARVVLGSRPPGVKTLEAATCDEALDAVAAVVALALSSQTETAAAREEETAQTAAASAAARAQVAIAQQAAPARQRAVSVRRIDAGAAREQSARRRSWRLLAGLGVDLGMLARPTLLVAGGAALARGRAELRAIGRYGVPSTSEEAAVELERLRVDFGATALDACWALDRAHWLSACGGLELSLTRSVFTREVAGARGQDRRVEPAFGPLAGLSLVLRDVPGQPQLELSAQLPLTGRAPAPGFRASLGGGVLF